MFVLIQTYMEVNIDPMSKMWMSLIGIGLMVVSAMIILFARMKTKGWIKLVLSLVAFVFLLLGFLYGILSII